MYRDGKDEQPNISRRDVISGKFWKLVRPAQTQPLVMRYPRTADDVQPDREASPASSPQSIGGIAIEPVAPTKLSGSASARSMPVFRPPGAIDESQFLAGCTRCSDCMDACPHDAIRKAPDRLGAIAQTPVIEADSSACMMCADFPCITACQPGVLRHSQPKIMGTARVTQHLCLAHHGTTCTVCSERCPVDGAISVANGRPIIDEQVCTGCGVCRHVCPAPENAILLMPTFNRPPTV